MVPHCYDTCIAHNSPFTHFESPETEKTDSDFIAKVFSGFSGLCHNKHWFYVTLSQWRSLRNSQYGSPKPDFITTSGHCAYLMNMWVTLLAFCELSKKLLLENKLNTLPFPQASVSSDIFWMQFWWNEPTYGSVYHEMIQRLQLVHFYWSFIQTLYSSIAALLTYLLKAIQTFYHLMEHWLTFILWYPDESLPFTIEVMSYNNQRDLSHYLL